jgi:hypothetical protein
MTSRLVIRRMTRLLLLRKNYKVTCAGAVSFIAYVIEAFLGVYKLIVVGFTFLIVLDSFRALFYDSSMRTSDVR